MKKIFATVLALALAFSFAAPVANVASAQAVSFNTNLTVGSRGADVTALQTFLQAKGYFPATQAVTAYFGPLTRSALAAYQSAKGITPAAGYFGPITRAAVSADMTSTTPVSTVPGCVAGALFSATTGQPCTTAPVSTVPGCLAGAAYSSTTGQPCTSTTAPVLTGTEGVVDVLLAPTPSNNSNVQTNVDVPVFGIEFRGKIAPVAVQTLDLQVGVQSGSSMENPGTLINTIKIWDGSNVVATVPVSLATFVRDSSNNYYVRISGINNFVVAPETTKTLTVSFSTNYIDTSRTVTVNAYGSAAIRTVSGNGISSFYGLTGASRTHIFQKPGNSTVTVSAAANPVRSQNAKLSTSVSTEATALLFNVKSENAASKVTTVVASTSASGVSATNLVFNLYDGSTKIDSKTGSTSVTFSNLNVEVAKDQTKTLTVKVEFPATSTGSQVAAASVTSVSFDNANGSTNTVSTTVYGAAQYAYAQSANLTLASAPTLTTSGVGGLSTTTTLTASFRLNVMPQGGDFVFANASGTVQFLNSAGTVVKAVPATVSKNTTTNIPDGSSEVVEVSAVLSSTDSQIAAGANQYRARLAGFDWTVGSNSVKQTYGFEDYITNLVTVNK